MQLKFSLEMMVVAEEILISQARTLGVNILSVFEQMERFVTLTNIGRNAEYARARLAAYAKFRASIEDAFKTMDEELGQARAEDDARDRKRAHEERERALDASEDKGEIKRIDRLAQRAIARVGGGGQAMDLACPLCENASRLDENGVCLEHGAYAIDLNDPNGETVVRYRPKPVGDAPPPGAPADAVRILKAVRSPQSGNNQSGESK